MGWDGGIAVSVMGVCGHLLGGDVVAAVAEPEEFPGLGEDPGCGGGRLRPVWGRGGGGGGED